MPDYFEHTRDGTIGPKTKSILDVYDEACRADAIARAKRDVMDGNTT